MPLYEFRCSECGIFNAWRTMAKCHTPAHCPTCQNPGKRIFSAPALLSGSVRLKRENPEPQRAQRDNQPERATPRSQGGRPWMIGH